MDRLLFGVMQHGAFINAAMAATPAIPAAPAAEPGAPENMLDSATQALAILLDSATAEGTESVFTEEMRQDAVAVAQEWADSELDSGEGYGDRLFSLIAGTAADGSGEDMTDEEAEYASNVAELVGDYLEEKGIPEDDIEALLGDLDFSNDVAARVHDMLLDKMPQGDDAMTDDAGKFVYGSDENLLDATYKKVVAIRAGKKVRIKKRVGGHVKLTAGQKAAVRKMQRKAFSGAAKMKRAKSMRIRMRSLGK